MNRPTRRAWTAPLCIAVLVAASAAAASPAPAPPQDPEPTPAEALAQAVALDDPDDRRRAARRLARRDVSVDRWLEICRDFGEFETWTPGIHRREVELHVDGRMRATELFLYVPRSYDPSEPAPLLVIQHGTSATGDGQHRWFQREAEQLGMLILSPSEQSPHGGYGYQQRERDTTLAAVRWARLRCNVDENRVILCGFSRGGHMTWDIGGRRPDLWAALVPIIGGPRIESVRGNNNTRYLENIAHLPIRDLQGAEDSVGMLRNLRLAFEWLEDLGADDAELIEFPDKGHDFDITAVDWVEFFGRVRRDPVPERVVRLAADADLGRAHWIEITDVSRDVDVAVQISVDPGRWKAMSNVEQRRFIHEKTLEHTARLEVERRPPGDFVARGREVDRFRLLLARDMIGEDGAVSVAFNGDDARTRVEEDAEVLLTEFVERFDRTFLPVAELKVR